MQTVFKTMLTLTFDPKIDELNDNGTVNHTYANREKERFLNTLSRKYSRLTGMSFSTNTATGATPICRAALA